MGCYRQCIFDPCADAILIQPSSLTQLTNSCPGVLPQFDVELDCSDAVFVTTSRHSKTSTAPLHTLHWRVDALISTRSSRGGAQATGHLL